MDNGETVAHWRIILAAILDFFTAFFVLGYVIAVFSGDLSDEGFHLSGLPAIILFGLIFLYFLGGQKIFWWDHLETNFKSPLKPNQRFRL